MKNKVGHIKSIWQFPVKSMDGHEISEGTFNKRGLEGDRMWTLWDELENELVGGKQFNKIMQLKATFTHPDQILSKPDVSIEFPDGSVVPWDAPYLNDLLSAFIGHPLSLKAKSDKWSFYLKKDKGMEKMRQILGLPADDSMRNLAVFSLPISLLLLRFATPPKILHDAFPVHFLSTNTLDWLKQAHPTAEFDPRRFKPTFLIDTPKNLGDHPETGWQSGYLEIGSTVIKVGPPTIRCSMPAQAQPGIRQDVEVAQAIQTTAGQFVGSYGTIKEAGKIAEGDEVIYRPAHKFWQMEAKYGRKMREPMVMTTAKIDSFVRNKILKKSNKINLKGGEFEPFQVVNIVDESKDTKSFYLRGKHFYSFLPGQHIILGLDLPNHSNPIIRSYSLSDYNPDSKTYRITVKREGDQGIASNYLHDRVKKNDTLYIKRPRGQFFLHPQEKRPLALISMGIGITPFRSMIEYAQKTHRKGKISFLHGCKNSDHHSFKSEIEAIKAQSNLEIFNCYSQANEADYGYQKKGRIDIQTIKEAVGDPNTVFYLCGTDAFMQELYADLIEWGVQAKDIHYEHFGKPMPMGTSVDDENQAAYQIHFSESNLIGTWDHASGNLLELAESLGLEPDYGCRYGICDACKVNIKEGSVVYDASIPSQNSNQSLLLCCAKPTSDLVLEL